MLSQQEAVRMMYEEVYCELEMQQQDRILYCLQIMASFMSESLKAALLSVSGILSTSRDLLLGMDPRLLVSPIVAPIVEAALGRPIEDVLQQHPEDLKARLKSGIVEHVSISNAAALVEAIANLQSVAGALSVSPDSWPGRSQLNLFAFCKELSRGPKSGLQARYNSAHSLLADMDVPEVSFCA